MGASSVSEGRQVFRVYGVLSERRAAPTVDFLTALFTFFGVALWVVKHEWNFLAYCDRHAAASRNISVT